MNSQVAMDDFNENVDAKLASRMRTVNPEQFQTLVKMHLSFELDLNTEDNDSAAEKAKLKRWNILNFTKKPKSTINLQQKGVEGSALTQDGISHVKHLVDYLSKEECIMQEGIFRRTGKLTRQQELKVALFQGSPLNLDNAQYSVHDCASVLKGYLAELPEPLLTDLHYPAHCQIAELCSTDATSNEPRLLRSLQLLLLLLPAANRTLLRQILKLLNKTATFEHSNKMNCDTLATLFTPHLMCPRKLSPEALHVNSQNLSGLVAFMIKMGLQLFEIPTKLAMDIRAYWVEQERKLLSPQKSKLNESTSDTTGTARTVFSFVDHKLTAEATAKQDTQVALAQLYATIQAMPESAKKRRLMKQMNKENAPVTPRHVKNCRTKSLGDSIKKHIFQKKLLGNKIKIGCNISRSNSEENIASEKLENCLHSPKSRYSKSDDDLAVDGTNNLLTIKPISNSTGSINTSLMDYKVKKKPIMLKGFSNISEENVGSRRSSVPKKLSPMGKLRNGGDTLLGRVRFSRQLSDPCEVNATHPLAFEIAQRNFVRKNSDPSFSGTSRPIEIVKSSIQDVTFVSLESLTEKSPPPRRKSQSVTHTSTPSNLLRRSFAASDHMFTPITKDDKSMSPITQSATKMTKAMQETMMTPRSRKPVMMISGSNICELASMEEQQPCTAFSGKRGFQLDNTCTSIVEESAQRDWNGSYEILITDEHLLKEKEKLYQERNIVTSLEDDCIHNEQKVSNDLREYFLSRSVLTASPVDLSFSSRTDDYEQSESDLNVLNDDALSESLVYCRSGETVESDTSGIVSGSAGSADNSADKGDRRKRGTSLQRNDSKRSIKEKEIRLKSNKHKQLSESNLKSKVKDIHCQETSF